jgi:hypothetical protein
MTVNATTETRKQYTGNSGYTTSTDFTASFNYLSTSEIQVVHTNTTTATDTNYVEGTHYSVQSGASATSVTIRFLSSHVPTATTEYITISRNMAFSQDTDYTEGSALDAETLEQNFDKAIMIAQQINNNLTDLNISFTTTNDFNTTAAAASDISISKANRASKALKFDSNGDIGVSSFDPDTQVADATAQAVAAAASAVAAASSESAAGVSASAAATAKNDLDAAVTRAENADSNANTSKTSATSSATAAAASAATAQATSIAMAIALGLVLTPFLN